HLPEPPRSCCTHCRHYRSPVGRVLHARRQRLPRPALGVGTGRDHPELRGYGIGAWASARSIKALARDECTLIVAKAAPLDASECRTGPDRDSDRDLTPRERAAWDAA